MKEICIDDQKVLKSDELKEDYPHMTLQKLIEMKRKNKKNKNITIDLSQTKYQVIKKVAG